MSFLQNIFASVALFMGSFFGFFHPIPAPIVSVTQIATSTMAQESVRSDSHENWHWISVSTPSIPTHTTDDISMPIDVASYEIFATSSDAMLTYCLARDKNNIYYVDGTIGDITSKIDADRATFVPFESYNPVSSQYGYCYGKDKTHVYWATWQDGGIIAGADPATFTTNSTIYPFARDASRVYLCGNVVIDADPNTFSLDASSGKGLDINAKDKNYTFWSGNGSVCRYGRTGDVDLR